MHRSTPSFQEGERTFQEGERTSVLVPSPGFGWKTRTSALALTNCECLPISELKQKAQKEAYGCWHGWSRTERFARAWSPAVRPKNRRMFRYPDVGRKDEKPGLTGMSGRKACQRRHTKSASRNKGEWVTWVPTMKCAGVSQYVRTTLVPTADDETGPNWHTCQCAVIDS